MSFNLLLKDQLIRFNTRLFPHLYSYTECTTDKDVLIKVITLQNYTLKQGAHIYVRFNNNSSTLPSSGNIMLNLNNTGNKQIVFSNTNKSLCTYEYADEFGDNKVIEFVYDGTYWVWVRSSSSTLSAGNGITISNNVISSKTDNKSILINSNGELNADCYSKNTIKNLCEPLNLLFPIESESSTKRGVEYTNNEDGTISATRVSSDSMESAYLIKTLDLEPGTYKITGCPQNGSSEKYSIFIYVRTYDLYINDYGNGESFTIAQTVSASVYCIVQEEYDAQNLVYKPRLVKVTNDGTITDSDALITPTEFDTLD